MSDQNNNLYPRMASYDFSVSPPPLPIETKRSAIDDDASLNSLLPSSKRSRIEDGDEEVYYFPSVNPTSTDAVDPTVPTVDGDIDQGLEEAVDFAMSLLSRQQQEGQQQQQQQQHQQLLPIPKHTNTLEFSVSPHRNTIGLQSNVFSTQICATIQARELPPNDTYARSPIDIVVALDVSGSMRVQKLDLCKQTLILLLRELHHEDRFGLVSFSEEATIEVPMQKVNEDNKQMALHTIEHLKVRGRTNIASAISLAAQVANSVTNPNNVRSVFILTDGQANCGYTEAKELIELTGIFVEKGHNPHTPPVVLHTFGYGPEPDQRLLMDMAMVTSGGSFYSIRDDSQAASAFGDAIGGILSVVAQNITLTLSVPETSAKLGAEIIAIHHDNKKEISNGANQQQQHQAQKAWQVFLGDLYAEESRDIVFEVTLASPPSNNKTDSAGEGLPLPHAQVELSYMDTILHTAMGPILTTAAIFRPSTSELSWPNHRVAIQWMRICTAKSIARSEELAKVEQLEPAKNELNNWMEELHRESFEIGAHADPLVIQLMNDLNECLEMVDEKLRNAENEGNYGGYNAYVSNELGVRKQTHLSQRCSEPLYVSGKMNIYRTGQKSLRAQAFRLQSGQQGQGQGGAD